MCAPPQAFNTTLTHAFEIPLVSENRIWGELSVGLSLEANSALATHDESVARLLGNALRDVANLLLAWRATVRARQASAAVGGATLGRVRAALNVSELLSMVCVRKA